jgi:DNA transposition AAA+ family ATPase
MAIDIKTFEALVVRLIRYQKNLGRSDKEFGKEFGEFIGSDRTWRYRIIAWTHADTTAREALMKKDPFDLEMYARQMQALVAKVDGGTAPARVFWEMPFAAMMQSLVTQLRMQTTDRRNLYVLATTGIGKSAVAKAMVNENPKDTTYCRMHSDCRNREKKILQRLGRAVGIFDPDVKSALFDQISDNLQVNPMTVFIDEAHEGGTLLMKIIKTLIDETPARFVQLAYPTEYDRVKTATAGALDEAKQILGRTMKPVYDDYRNGLRDADVICFLTRSGLEEGDARDITPQIMGAVRANGNLRVLEDAVSDALAVSQARGITLEAAMVKKAVEAQCPAQQKKGDR